MVRTERAMMKKLATGLCLVVLLAFVYVAAYFATARRGATITVAGKWAAWPEYVGLPDSGEVCFRSLHNWDRSCLRPGFWAGTIPPDQLRQQQLLAAEFALRAARAAATKE
jgi:hypothetical protein